MEYVLKGKNRSASPNYVLVIETCYRCSGTGRYPSAAYQGRCLACATSTGNTGHLGYYRPTTEWQAVLDDRREKREAKKAEKARAARVAAAEAAAWLWGVALFCNADADNNFAYSVLRQAWEGKTLSAKQAWALLGSALRYEAYRARKAAEAAAPKAEVPEGRERVAGEIVSLREEDDPYSYHGGRVLKMLLKEERGFKLWGTVPRSLYEAAEKGAKVAFTARLTRSADDSSFGFYSRPTKAEVL